MNSFEMMLMCLLLAVYLSALVVPLFRKEARFGHLKAYVITVAVLGLFALTYSIGLRMGKGYTERLESRSIVQENEIDSLLGLQRDMNKLLMYALMPLQQIGIAADCSIALGDTVKALFLMRILEERGEMVSSARGHAAGPDFSVLFRHELDTLFDDVTIDRCDTDSQYTVNARMILAAKEKAHSWVRPLSVAACEWVYFRKHYPTSPDLEIETVWAARVLSVSNDLVASLVGHSMPDGAYQFVVRFGDLDIDTYLFKRRIGDMSPIFPGDSLIVCGTLRDMTDEGIPIIYPDSLLVVGYFGPVMGIE